jgi:hypothetical protein
VEQQISNLNLRCCFNEVEVTDANDFSVPLHVVFLRHRHRSADGFVEEIQLGRNIIQLEHDLKSQQIRHWLINTV